MFRVVNGSGTGAGSKIDINGVHMAGKTGTAQVRALTSRGHVGDWKSRDHSLFICYAPTDTPRYAMSVVIEHGTFGARAAAPIAKDVMTFLYDPAKAWDTLLGMEKGWGGTPAERMAAKYKAYAAQYGTTAPKVEGDAAVSAAEYGTRGDTSAGTVTAEVETVPAGNDGLSSPPRAPTQPSAPAPATAASPAPSATPAP
jgi:penicillin-binding protein 2